MLKVLTTIYDFFNWIIFMLIFLIIPVFLYPFYIIKNFKRLLYDKLFYIVTGLTFFFDQYTKLLAIKHLKYQDDIIIIKGLLHFTYVENKGAAMGLLPGQVWLFKIIAIVAVLIIVWYSATTPKEEVAIQTGLAFLLGGALGNFMDRLKYGAVIDFIDVHYKTFQWPVFNVADTMIDIGVGILIIKFLFFSEEDE